MRVDPIQDLRATRPPLTATQIVELADELRADFRRLVPDTALVPGTEVEAVDLRAQARLPLILAALQRVDAGTYGFCLVCRSPIPFARLAAIPETRTCVDCVWRPAEGSVA